jgi:iron(III) transport system substrate-binding protein
MPSLGAAALALALVAAACGGSGAEEPPPAGEQVTLTVYSGRDEEFIGPLYDGFQEATGIELEVRYGDSAELAATILEEGEASPADVYVSQDAGALGVVAGEGLLAEIDDEILGRVDERFRSPEGLWVGASGRARVIAYNTDAVSADELPGSVVDLTGPAYEGRVGFPPTNASFQAFVAAMIVTEGEDRARAFLEGLAGNDPTLYESNSDTVRAIAAGEVDLGLVNHYYIYEVAAEDGPIPVENHFLTGGDPGALVNAAGAGVLTTSDAPEEAMRLLEYLTSEEGQTYFATETFEYPVVEGIEPREELPPLADIESPGIDLSDLGETLEPALRLLAEVGLL